MCRWRWGEGSRITDRAGNDTKRNQNPERSAGGRHFAKHSLKTTAQRFEKWCDVVQQEPDRPGQGCMLCQGPVMGTLAGCLILPSLGFPMSGVGEDESMMPSSGAPSENNVR